MIRARVESSPRSPSFRAAAPLPIELWILASPAQRLQCQRAGYQVDEHVRHRAVERLESELSQVARTGADTAQGHLGHALGREARDEAVAQVARAVDVDVARRVVVGPRKDREEVEVLRGSLHRIVRVLQAAQLHLRLQETVFLPGRADGGHVLPRVGQQVDLRARVVVPEGHERSHQFREGARNGDVVLRHARRHRGLLCVHRRVAEHKRPS